MDLRLMRKIHRNTSPGLLPPIRSQDARAVSSVYVPTIMVIVIFTPTVSSAFIFASQPIRRALNTRVVNEICVDESSSRIATALLKTFTCTHLCSFLSCVLLNGCHIEIIEGWVRIETKLQYPTHTPKPSTWLAKINKVIISSAIHCTYNVPMKGSTGITSNIPETALQVYVTYYCIFFCAQHCS